MDGCVGYAHTAIHLKLMDSQLSSDKKILNLDKNGCEIVSKVPLPAML